MNSPMSDFRILCVHGGTRANSKLATLLALASDAAQRQGAQIYHFDLAEFELPQMRVGCPEQAQNPAVVACREMAKRADAFLIGTPEYHGAMSGVLKNWFDFLYREFAGKMAAAVCSTGAGNGDLPLTSIMTSVAWCHGFALPFRVTAKAEDFNEQGELCNDRVKERAQRVGADLYRYGKLLRAEFAAAKEESDSIAQGFAGYHK